MGFLYAIAVQLYLQGMQLIVFSILSYVFMSSARVERILSKLFCIVLLPYIYTEPPIEPLCLLSYFLV